MSNINVRLGRKIRTLRRAKKMTQEELAYQAKMDYSYLNEIEMGKRNPTIKRITTIARALNVTLSDLFR